jgi:adenosine deaminase
MHDFPLHMRMMHYLHSQYPNVHVTLHAGELVEGLVPPEGLRFHVRDSIETAGAERIGHGVDTLNETRPLELLHEMAQKNVMVEICLTSNDVILGVRGRNHPLHDFMNAGIPVALGTDDEGVARSDMTHEYLRGAQDQGLSYAELKRMARTSLEHAFISGGSLWSEGTTFTPIRDCAAALSASTPSPACQKFLDSSEKARLQLKLEQQFRQFEEKKRMAVPVYNPAED